MHDISQRVLGAINGALVVGVILSFGALVVLLKLLWYLAEAVKPFFLSSSLPY